MGDFKDMSTNGHDSQQDQHQTQSQTRTQIMDLPSDLEKIMIEQFDRLVDKGEIAWAPYDSEPYEEDGFKVSFDFVFSPLVYWMCRF